MGEAAPAEEFSFDPSWLRPSKTRSKRLPIKGLYFIKRSMTRKQIENPDNRVGMQCMQGEDGTYYYIPLDSYNPSHLEIINEVSPLLVNPMPSQFEPGAMYTYIIASIITKDPSTGMDKPLEPMKLYASKALNMFEFGTKHHQIFHRMAQTGELDHVARKNDIPINRAQYGLHASGEIRCINENTLEFNFFSGTYKMKVKINKKRAKFEMGVVTYLMEEIDPSYNIKFVFSPLIVPEVMSITHAQIERLKSHGIPVFSFNTREQCKNMQYIAMKYKRTEKVEMRPDQMNALYEKSKARLPLSSIFPWMFQAPAPADSSVSAASSVPAADKGGKKRTLKKRTKK